MKLRGVFLITALLCAMVFGAAFPCAEALADDTILYPAVQNGLWGYIDKDGEWIIPPRWHYEADYFNEDGVVWNDDEGEWINKQG